MVSLPGVRAGAGDAPEGGEIEDGDRRGRLSLRVLEAGSVARAALSRSRGRASPLGGSYYLAGGDIVWVGARLAAMHPRAVLTESAPRAEAALTLSPLPKRGWSPRLPRLRDPALLSSVAAALDLGLDRAAGRVKSLARAYARDDPDEVFLASCELLGRGGGLTPSGDDLAGGALFGRRLACGSERRWVTLGRRLCEEVGRRSNAVSAALFADLARGRSFAPLHALADALVKQDESGALRAARELSRVGHSSGREMLAGVVLGASPLGRG